MNKVKAITTGTYTVNTIDQELENRKAWTEKMFKEYEALGYKRACLDIYDKLESGEIKRNIEILLMNKL
jgi:hypothetical protein